MFLQIPILTKFLRSKLSLFIYLFYLRCFWSQHLEVEKQIILVIQTCEIKCLGKCVEKIYFGDSLVSAL